MSASSAGFLWALTGLLSVQAGVLLAAEAGTAGETGARGAAQAFDWSRERKTTALNLGIVGGVAAYGFANWDWGESSFRSRSEGWFGRHTASGGADKLGHAYTGAVGTALAASLYRRWGYDEEQAARLGAFSGLLLTSAVELGDGFSPDHGFSWEDQLANMAGVGLEYLRLRHPDWRARVQFRWEYFPSPAMRRGKHGDISTDYSGSRWMLAFPLRAWGAQDSPLRYFDLLVGYGTRGYAKSDREFFDEARRHPFVGVGLHLPLLLDTLGASPGTQRLFEYLQVPGSALPLPP
ncbi:YfiM family protein [Pseudomonas stutzeri]|nr:YfiM family protein [Stutzerimonas stutzeri]